MSGLREAVEALALGALARWAGEAADLEDCREAAAVVAGSFMAAGITFAEHPATSAEDPEPRCVSGWCGPWRDDLCVDCGKPRYSRDYALVDACEHGIDYDHDCSDCDALTELARADGAETPREMGIWERAYDRNHTRAHTAADEFAAEFGHAHPWVAKIRALGDA